MDGNNWNAAALGGEAAVDGSDWRATLQADTRGRIVSKIMETLKRHLPFHNQEGLQELQKIAVRFEEKIYTVATSQSDYLRKISVKMLTLPANSAGDVSNPSVAGASPSMQSQDPSQGQSLPIPLPANQPQPRPQLLTQNNMHSAGLQSSATLQSSLPPVSGMNQIPINDADQNASMQNMYNIAQNPGQGVLLNMFGNTHRQMPGRNQFFGQQQQQQLQNPQQYLYKQQQFQQQLLLNQRNLAHAMMQSQLQQQQQQNGLQSSQFQQPQQFGMQTSSVMQPSVMQSSSTLANVFHWFLSIHIYLIEHTAWGIISIHPARFYSTNWAGKWR
ncbi:Mediator of RNA polymerase II transcription subunit 15a [Linum perenne]